MLLNILDNLLILGEILKCHRREPCPWVLFPLLEVNPVHPLDCIETLLKDVIRAGANVINLPRTQSVRFHDVLASKISPDLFHGDSEIIVKYGVEQASAAESSKLCRLDLLIGDSIENFDVVALVHRIRGQARDRIPFFGDHPCRRYGDHPAGSRAPGLDAIEVELGPVPFRIMLNAHIGDRLINMIGDIAHFPLDLSMALRGSSYNIEAASNGIEPDPEKVSASRVRRPKRIIPSCSTSPDIVRALVPR